MHLLFLTFWFSCITLTSAYQEDGNKQQKEKAAANLPAKRTLYGTASYYADKFEGRQTANGEIYSHIKLTAACNRLPLGTWIRVTNMRNKRSVIVRINDRLHPKNPRLVDMSRSGAEQLGFIKRGLTQVKIDVLTEVKTR